MFNRVVLTLTFTVLAASVPESAAAAPTRAPRAPALVRSAQPEPDREGEQAVVEDSPEPRARDSLRRKPEWAVLRAVPAYSRVNLTTLRVTDGATSAALVPSRMGGPSIDGSAGVRLLFVTLAVRGGVGLYPRAQAGTELQDFRMLRVNGDLLLHLLTGYRVEPYLLLSGGYAELQGSGSGLGPGDRLRGPNAEGGIGLDYYPRERVSVGAILKGGVYFLTRPGTSARDLLRPEQVQTVGEARTRLSEGDGSTLGTGFTLGIGTGLHF